MSTTIKFEGLHDDLKDLHMFLYAKDNTLNFNEEYQATPGINKAPDLIALIIYSLPAIAVPTLKVWIKEYFAYKKAKLKQNKKIKISQTRGGTYQEIGDMDGIE